MSFRAFFQPGSDPARDVLGAASALEAGESAGEVTKPWLFTAPDEPPEDVTRSTAPEEQNMFHRLAPFPGGALCERIFGPIGSPERKTRTGHIHVKSGVVHPALSPEVTVHVIPVLPPGDRPLVVEDGDVIAGPVNVAYQRLLRAKYLLDLSDRYGAPGDQRADYQRQLQAAFEVLCRAINGDASVDAWEPCEDPSPAPPAEPGMPTLTDLRLDEEPSRLTGVAIAGPKSLLLTFSQRTLHLRRSDGAALGVIDAPSASVAYVDGAGKRAVLAGWRVVREGDWVAATTDFFALDLQKHALGGPLPNDMVPAYFNEVMEQSWLVDAAAGRSLRLLEVADYPVFQAFTPDHRYVWAEDKERSGGVYHTKSGALHAMMSDARESGEAPLLRPDGRLIAADDYDPDDLDEELEEQRRRVDRAPTAIVRLSNGVFRTFHEGVVADDGKALFCVGWVPWYAAFSRKGNELCLADNRELITVSVRGRPKIIERFALNGLMDPEGLEKLERLEVG